jgi:hemerythrin superfamily protein
MDALELLRQDHDTVRGLFDQFNAAKESEDTQQMAQVFEQLVTELKIHTAIEEEVFYPEAREVGGEAEELVLEGVEEHHVVDQLIEEIEGLDPSDERWAAKVTVLIENVDHHAEEEEEELFPKLRKAFGDERLQRMGDELEEAKSRHMSQAGEAGGASGKTRDELYEEAKRQDIPGRSNMTKEELGKALGES